ncbi:MBL fold metallo-hydrolase [Methyloceanibacter superfactus]|uniref:MBL fold metallo-hydrolase n=1 Tax=Methyloceanibacter superfactus TaxID=1774969 RepID=A0A1E3VR44_9HYPH|nr:MBL fold metallo-hydrolase [Methyloceanibacter superfactus]
MPKLTTNRRRLIAGAGALTLAPLAAALAPRRALAAAPMLGVSQPTYYRFKLGDFEVTTISDAAAFIDGPWPLIGGNATQAEVDQVMRDDLLPTNKYRPGFTPMIVNTGRELILFDTGNGERGFVPRPAGGWLKAQLGPAGFKPEEIDVVVLSHGHPDHIGGVIEKGRPLFPNARYVIGDKEYGFWAGDKPAGDLQPFAALFRDYVVPLAGKTTFLKPGDDVTPGIRAIEAYGHTPGHLAFDIESIGKRLVFWGDCAHHQVASLARPDWHCVFDVDKAQGAKTRARMFDRVATDRVAVSAFHMPFPSLGYVERRKEGGYRWIPQSYQLDL